MPSSNEFSRSRRPWMSPTAQTTQPGGTSAGMGAGTTGFRLKPNISRHCIRPTHTATDIHRELRRRLLMRGQGASPPEVEDRQFVAGQVGELRKILKMPDGGQGLVVQLQARRLVQGEVRPVHEARQNLPIIVNRGGKEVVRQCRKDFRRI